MQNASSFSSLEALEASILKSLQNIRQEALPSLYADVMGFYHAIDWSERWLLALASFHLVVWGLVYRTRRSYEIQMGLFVAIRERLLS